MNITFMIGNGFDVGMGLHTKYAEFYPYFTDYCDKDNMLKEQIEKDEESGKYEKWADLEVAIGRFTTEVFENSQEKFIADKLEMDDLLIDYLKKERELAILDDIKIKKVFEKAVSDIWKGNNREEQDAIDNICNKHKGEHYIYRAINFNYTDAFDYCFRVAGKVKDVISEKADGRSNIAGRVHHVHGTLEDGELILGVNDEQQILNPTWRDVENIKRCLIKPYLNKKIGQKKTEIGISMILESNVICLYGVSIGDTDRLWWKEVGDWLLASEERILIIFVYIGGYQKKSAYKWVQDREKIQQQFISKTNIQAKDIERVMGRIIVRMDENIFEIK